MERSSLLKKALLGNAAFSVLTGTPMLFFPEPLSRILGFSAPQELRDLGVSLLFFAVVLTITATRRRIRLWAAGTITAMDVAWVLGTAALLIGRPDTFNTTGTVAAVVVAVAVADFAALQIMGIRRLTKGGRKRDDEGSVAPFSPAARTS